MYTLCLITGLALLLIAAAPDEARFAVQREGMVHSQLAARGINDSATLPAMGTVPRHLFVPRETVDDAYTDRPLPIGYDQTISHPLIVATMTELTHPRPEQRVLEIGTGSGYPTAVLARIVREVCMVEIIPELSDAARERLRRLG